MAAPAEPVEFRASDSTRGRLPGSPEIIGRLLRAVREHLDLDVAFIGEFVGGQRVLRYVDADEGASPVEVLHSDPLEESYCAHVAAGRLPQLLLDPAHHPVSARLPVTATLPVGSHLSVPIRFSDGRVYGTFCCFSFDVKDSLDLRDLQVVKMMAQLAGEYLEVVDAVEARQRQRRELVSGALGGTGGLTMVFQPLRDIETMQIVAFEALARFPGDQGPEWFFAQAHEAGLGIDLEMGAVRLALAALEAIPEPIRLNVNISPETLYTEDFSNAVRGVPRDRLVMEVTEHAAVGDYTHLKAAAARLAEAGIRLAVDDVGMGFSGLNRILETSPNELKLDAKVIRDVDSNPVKQALVETFCSFGRRAGFNVVAEGIETEAELAMLRALGAQLGQGYHLGRPAPLDAFLRAGHGG